MSQSPKNNGEDVERKSGLDKEEHLLALFRQSKKTVQKFVDAFREKHGRRPHGTDLASAPQNVRTCIKNCKRIQAKLSKKSEPKNDDYSKVKNDDSKMKEESKNKKRQPLGKIWGHHLNRSVSESAAMHQKSKDVARSASYSGTLSALLLQELSKNTRSSLKKRPKNVSSQHFFHTMGEESTLQGLFDSEETTKDPLARFHPEISMDGLSQQEQPEQEEEDLEMSDSNVTKTTVTTRDITRAPQSVSFLSAVNSTRPDANKVNDRTYNDSQPLLSFSGLFPREEESSSVRSKRKSEEIDGEPEAKKQRDEQDDEVWSDEDLFADENVDGNNIQCDNLLPQSNFDDDDDDEDEEKEKKKKKPDKNKKFAMVTNNFVKINLKKKNYVRGHKSMSGAKHRRMEWKRKVAAKFGKKK